AAGARADAFVLRDDCAPTIRNQVLIPAAIRRAAPSSGNLAADAAGRLLPRPAGVGDSLRRFGHGFLLVGGPTFIRRWTTPSTHDDEDGDQESEPREGAPWGQGRRLE